jgi:hypothetical protein
MRTRFLWIKIRSGGWCPWQRIHFHKFRVTDKEFKKLSAFQGLGFNSLYIYSVFQYKFLPSNQKNYKLKLCSNRSEHITAVYQFDEQQTLHFTALSCMETNTEHALRHPSSLSPTVLNHTLQQTDFTRRKK